MNVSSVSTASHPAQAPLPLRARPLLFPRPPSRAASFHPRLRATVEGAEAALHGLRCATTVLVGAGSDGREPTRPRPQVDSRGHRLARAALAQGVVGHGLRLGSTAVFALGGLTVGFAAAVGMAAIGSSDRARAALRAEAGGALSVGVMLGASLGAVAGAHLGQRLGLGAAAAARLVLATAPLWLAQMLVMGALRGVDRLVRARQAA